MDYWKSAISIGGKKIRDPILTASFIIHKLGCKHLLISTSHKSTVAADGNVSLFFQ